MNDNHTDDEQVRRRLQLMNQHLEHMFVSDLNDPARTQAFLTKLSDRRAHGETFSPGARRDGRHIVARAAGLSILFLSALLLFSPAADNATTKALAGFAALCATLLIVKTFQSRRNGSRELYALPGGWRIRFLGIVSVFALAVGFSVPLQVMPLDRVQDNRVETLPGIMPMSAGSNASVPVTTPSSAGPLQYRQVYTRSGMRTVVPVDWPVVDCVSGNGCEQATDPGDNERFLRFGGSPSSSRSLWQTISDYERSFGKRPGYKRLQLADGVYQGYPSVEWEFEYQVNGVLKRIRVQYWRAGGNDNLVYASSIADKWNQTLPIYQAMIADSSHHS